MPEIQYIPGSQMVVADALSRCTQVDDPEDYLASRTHDVQVNTLTAFQTTIADTQAADPVLKQIIGYITTQKLPAD